MKCPSCGTENPEGNAFCGSCGQRLVPGFEKVPVEGDEGAFYCYRHKREPTRLSCGRCGKPICTRCAVNGPAGIRCPECAKQNIAFRPMGAVSDVTRGLRNIGRAGPYSIYILIVALSMLSFLVRGCMMSSERREPPVRQSRQNSDE